ncbi:MAG: hypothetical protein V4850_17800 [Myxococcota bacterium]
MDLDKLRTFLSELDFSSVSEEERDVALLLGQARAAVDALREQRERANFRDRLMQAHAVVERQLRAAIAHALGNLDAGTYLDPTWPGKLDSFEAELQDDARLLIWHELVTPIAYPTSADGEGAVLHAPSPSLPAPPPPPTPVSADLIERIRALKPIASSAPRHGAGVWGVDFGTARSKVVFRPRGGFTQAADSVVAWDVPSVLAVEEDGGAIEFGEAAEARRGKQGWKLVTSLKRHIVGRRVDPYRLPPRMTTEGLATLYMAWLCHEALRRADLGASPMDLPMNLSMPLVDASVANDGLRAPFVEGPRTYDIWLSYALRAAQLIALTFGREEFPSSQTVLLDALELWSRQNWESVRRSAATTSEPAAVVGDVNVTELPAGLTMLVDCGAGTTDVSVFWRRGAHVFRVVECSVVVGGDQIDDAIVLRVVREFPGLKDREGDVRTWARAAKRDILEGEASFDPAEFELPGLAFDITAEDVAPGVAALAGGVHTVVARAADQAFAKLLETSLNGAVELSRARELQAVWLIGGSSVVGAVMSSVEAALRGSNVVGASPAPLAPSGLYAAWKPERYRLLAVALGASRPDLARPALLPPDQADVAVGLHHTDKDA